MSTSRKFVESEFVPTQHSSAADKAAFANHFVRFLESGFSQKLFPDWFYRRLSMTFGHIAHYNREGFFATFFTTEEDKLEFLSQTLSYPCYGDPAYTYSDVEKALQDHIRRRGFVEIQRDAVAVETRNAEMATLARLQEKYGQKTPAPKVDTVTKLLSSPQQSLLF